MGQDKIVKKNALPNFWTYAWNSYSGESNMQAKKQMETSTFRYHCK